MEVEIDAALVLSRKVKMRMINGESITGDLRVYESEDPYVLVVTVQTDNQDDLRMDIFKEDLAREMRAWLEGKYIRYPSVVVPVRIDESMMKFIKFAKPPKQEDLIMWILSRTEYYPRGVVAEHDEEIENGGYGGELIFGGKSLEDMDDKLIALKLSLSNQFAKTSTIAAAHSTVDDENYLYRQYEEGSHRQHNTARLILGDGNTTMNSKLQRPQSASARISGSMQNHSEDLGMFEMTRQLLGKSGTLEALKSGRRSIKGREGAKQVLQTNSWSNDHWRLCNEIERTRKDIEQRMDERRRVIEVARIRQQQQAEKFRKIRHQIHESKGGNQFVSNATEELMTLKKIEADIEEDIRKQRNRIHRSTQRVSWTMAPSGFVDRRGKSQRGPVLGPGPLHPNATSSLKDPKIESTIKRFYWDSAGRRHIRHGKPGEDDEETLIEQAMAAIRKAAANLSAYKLDLKTVFEQFDTSGDGFLSEQEMAQAFLSMGVKLDMPTAQAIFRHFDPNDSGGVHYGEFVWAFFNRRGLVRQWKRKTNGMTTKKVYSIFHAADINGNGRLNSREFKKLLRKEFHIDISDEDLEILISRFDADGDGDIDIEEFLVFIESEQQNFMDPSKSLAMSSSVAFNTLLPNPLPRSQSPNIVKIDATQCPREIPSPTGSTTNPVGRGRHKSSSVERKPPKVQLNTTAPGALETNARNLLRDENDEAANNTRGEEEKKAVSKTEITRLIHRQDESVELNKDVDVLWMSRMLQAQAEVESRLGHRYFKNN